MKKLIFTLAAMAVVATSHASISAVTGLDESTPFIEFIRAIQNDTTKKDAFLSGLGGVKHTQVSLSAAQIIAMYTTPVVLVAAPGAGKAISIHKVIFTITRTSTAFTGGGAVIIQYAATANGGGTQSCDSTLASTVITGSAGVSQSFRNGAIISDSSAVTNAGLYISNATAVFAAGTGTAKVDIFWSQNP